MAEKKKDGLGNPIVADRRYFVQDSRPGGIVGNCVMWWCPNGAGYACDIREAGVYIGSEVMTMRPTDVPWPEEMVLEGVRHHVRIEHLHNARKHADQRRVIAQPEKQG